MTPLVSIITPTYNYAIFLPEIIQSVLDQTYENWELIIVDDGSTDNTSEVVQPYLKDHRICYIYQDNTGVSTARNKGIEKANGDYIQFLDADDLISKDKLKRHIVYMIANPQIDVAYSADAHFEHPGEYRFVSYPKIPGTHEKRLEQVLRVNPISTGNPLIKAEIVRKTRGFIDGITRGQDWLFWFEVIFNRAIFGKCDGVLYFIRTHNTPRKRSYIRSHILLRKEISNFNISRKHKYLSRNYKYWFIVEEAKRAKDIHWVIFYSIIYILLIHPKTLSHYKIFIGDILKIK
ncbi:MAG: glycosyltransferase family 2 protein [Bacteroidota bacterium]